MSAPDGLNAVTETRRSRFLIDRHYSVNELEWNRIVGTDGLAWRFLEAMADLSKGAFRFENLRRVPMSNAERFEFSVGGISQSVQFDYDVSPTLTLLQGLRHLFGEVNTALRRAGIDWRYVLTRDYEGDGGFDYGLLLVPRSVALEYNDDIDVVAGLEVQDFELGR